MRTSLFHKIWHFRLLSVFFFLPATSMAQELVLPDSLSINIDTLEVKNDSIIADSLKVMLDPLMSESGIFEDISTSGLLLKDTIGPEELDSIMQNSIEQISFNRDDAIEYISRWYKNVSIWNNPNDPLRKAMGRYLYEATNDQFYISEWYINAFEWDNIKIPTSSFYLWDTLHIVLPVLEDIKEDSLNIVSDTTSLPARSAKRDSIVLVLSDTLSEVISANELFPFSYYNNPMVGDSIKAAMDILTAFTHEKDSSRLVFIGSKEPESMWLSDNPNRMTRLWLVNEWGEELSIWLGSPSRDSVSVIAERGVHFRRPNKETRIANARLGVETIDNSTLADPKKIKIVPRYWKFNSEASFVFNQAIIKNWSKGGNSNISTVLDVTGNANYTNTEENMAWSTAARFKYGLMMTEGYGERKYDVQKNIDLIDITSKFNNKAFGKFDFSAMMIFKTQLAKGYKYPNDSVVVSKFFNPATLTIGLGLDYKPNKNTSINFAPLSYKGTFVPDTVAIDQTKHGLTADQRSKHEPGMSIQVNHKTILWDMVNLTNKVRLFTNYIDDPLNIDIEWEMIATAKLNWFTDVRLNTHLIYDDDTLIPSTDKDGEPILGSDGNQKKVPKVQFKEVFGVSVIFRF